MTYTLNLSWVALQMVLVIPSASNRNLRIVCNYTKKLYGKIFSQFTWLLQKMNYNCCISNYYKVFQKVTNFIKINHVSVLSSFRSFFFWCHLVHISQQEQKKLMKEWNNMPSKTLFQNCLSCSFSYRWHRANRW